MYHTYTTGRCEPEYATKGGAYGVGIPALVTGSLALLNQMSGGNGIGGILGGNNCYRDLAEKDAKIAALQTDVKLRDAQLYTDQKTSSVVEYFNGRLNCIERQLADQQTYNAVNTSTITCLKGQIAQLLGVTKTVIPNENVCPGYGPVTITPAAAAAA